MCGAIKPIKARPPTNKTPIDAKVVPIYKIAFYSFSHLIQGLLPFLDPNLVSLALFGKNENKQTNYQEDKIHTNKGFICLPDVSG